MANEDWKQRYLKEARAWETAEQLLCKLIGRLAIAAAGLSKDLDRVLERIQGHARDADLAGLESDLEALATQIRKMDSLAPPPTAEPATTNASPAPVPGMPDPGVSAPGAETVAKTASEARTLLLTLIDEIVVAQPGLANLETLRETLQADQETNWQRALGRVLDELRGLINKISSDKHALEQLMLEISEELGDISQVLVDDRSGLDEGQQQAALLQNIMRSGVEQIQSHIDAETDIQRLKAGVSQSLEGIRHGISDFIAKDSARFAAARERNEVLQARIDSMEQESGRLKEQLTRNRKKLMFDTLTGVRSRMAYDEILAKELSRYRRYRTGFSVAVLDIDFFKRVNDTFGHSAGDKALKLVASLVDQRIRETDFLFRVGGEEFVLLLPNTPPEQAKSLVETVLLAVGESGFHYESQPVPITLSAGLTGVRDDDSAESLFARADEALYQAKKGGRNRLVIAAP